VPGEFHSDGRVIHHHSVHSILGSTITDTDYLPCISTVTVLSVLWSTVRPCSFHAISYLLTYLPDYLPAPSGGHLGAFWVLWASTRHLPGPPASGSGRYHLPATTCACWRGRYRSIFRSGGYRVTTQTTGWNTCRSAAFPLPLPNHHLRYHVASYRAMPITCLPAPHLWRCRCRLPGVPAFSAAPAAVTAGCRYRAVIPAFSYLRFACLGLPAVYLHRFLQFLPACIRFFCLPLGYRSFSTDYNSTIHCIHSGVRAGRSTVPLEIQECHTFLGGATNSGYTTIHIHRWRSFLF